MDIRILERLWNNVQKPAKYTGGEINSVIKDKDKVDIRFAFCFPDLYEIGMSHLGLKILYAIKNAREDIWCERVFVPDTDMQQLMKKEDVPLYGLESLDPIKDFDFIGFSLGYEMSYTGVLNMLDLAGVPLLSKDRPDLAPMIIAGGPCTSNPESMHEFIDIFVIGEGEEVNLELIDLYKIAKKEKWSKQQYLEKASEIQGIYVPALYNVSYNEDGTINKIAPIGNAPKKIKKRIIEDISSVYYPEEFVIPYVDVVHDRSMLEVLRGCIHGCRFCQAGFIYRPYREKDYKVLARDAERLTENTGYEEISLTSLSTSDHSQLEDLLEDILPWTTQQRIGISLPSLRIDAISPKLLEQISSVRKTSLTFAPEAGTQRLRDVINKNITEEEVMTTCKQAFEQGYTSVKLYFMMGLPTETLEDIAGINTLAEKVVDLYYQNPNRQKSKPVSVSISVACFVPKPFTPFEFERQDTMEEFMEKQKYLKSCIKDRKIRFSYHDSPTSLVEAVLARGDRRLSRVIYKAWEKGSILDSWNEHFKLENWLDSMKEEGLDPAFYANRKRDYDEVSPWSHIDIGVTKDYLIRENKKAYNETTTPNCRDICMNCGGANLYVQGERRLPCK